MEFILRIYFMGLIAFVPGHDGQEMNVLLLDAREGYSISDGSEAGVHTPLLVARSSACEGDCSRQAQQVADFLFQRARRPSADESLRQLQAALQGGSAWILDDSSLSIQVTGSPSSAQPLQIYRSPVGRDGARSVKMPANPLEAEDFRWVADIGKISPGAGTIDPRTLSKQPEKVVARLTLTSGVIKTHALVTWENKILPLPFSSLREIRSDFSKASATGYTQALANWVVAEIPIQGDQVKIHDQNFKSGASRSVDLRPIADDGGRAIVEVAIINLPADNFRAGGTGQHRLGKHFEKYYELSITPPPEDLRPVPFVDPATHPGIPWANFQTRTDQVSSFLDMIGLPRRGILGWPICPSAQFTMPNPEN